jgi:hypothetical protein
MPNKPVIKIDRIPKAYYSSQETLFTWLRDTNAFLIADYFVDQSLALPTGIACLLSRYFAKKAEQAASNASAYTSTALPLR